MPIRRENMKSINGMILTEDTNHGKIYQFLRERSSLAYTREELSQLLDIPVESVGPSLTRLKQEDLVEHQGRYWMIHQDETGEVTQHGSKNNGGYSNETKTSKNKQRLPSVTELLQEYSGEEDQTGYGNIHFWMKTPNKTGRLKSRKEYMMSDEIPLVLSVLLYLIGDE